jgi:hypothetical protein
LRVVRGRQNSVQLLCESRVAFDLHATLHERGDQILLTARNARELLAVGMNDAIGRGRALAQLQPTVIDVDAKTAVADHVEQVTALNVTKPWIEVALSHPLDHGSNWIRFSILVHAPELGAASTHR